MAADPKILTRIGNLLRLAAPSSGTTDAERASAAIEAARLIEEHDIRIDEIPRPSKGPVRVAPDAWVMSVALQHSSCSACHGAISPDDIVWLRIVKGHREFRHNYGKCAIA